MQNITFEYATICSTCKGVNYPMSTSQMLQDSDIFDPYELPITIEATCINCGQESMQSLKLVKYMGRIFDVNAPLVSGSMSLIARKLDNQLSEVNFSSSFFTDNPYHKLNALSVMEGYVNHRQKQFENDSDMQYTQPSVFLIYNKAETGSLYYEVLFKQATPYIKMKAEEGIGFSFNEILNVIENLKTEIYRHMNKNKLITFNSTHDSRDGFYL